MSKIIFLPLLILIFGLGTGCVAYKKQQVILYTLDSVDSVMGRRLIEHYGDMDSARAADSSLAVLRAELVGLRHRRVEAVFVEYMAACHALGQMSGNSGNQYSTLGVLVEHYVKVKDALDRRILGWRRRELRRRKKFFLARAWRSLFH
jgi:hypothetical protein